MSDSLNKKILVLILLSMVILSASTENELARASDEVEDTLYEVEVSLAFAFHAIYEAEVAGADVRGLPEELNLLLEGFQVARQVIEGDGNEFSKKQARLILPVISEAAQDISERAVQMRNLAVYREADASMLQILLTVVLCIEFFLLGFLGWIYFKRAYFRRIMDYGVELSDAES